MSADLARGCCFAIELSPDKNGAVHQQWALVKEKLKAKVITASGDVVAYDMQNVGWSTRGASIPPAKTIGAYQAKGHDPNRARSNSKLALYLPI